MAGVGLESLCILAGLLVFCLIAGCTAEYECYDCNSHDHSWCADPFSPAHKPVNCTAVKGSDFKYCRKIRQIVKDMPDRVVRECASTIDKLGYYERTGTYKVKLHYYICKGERCNSASQISSIMALIIGLINTAFYI